MRKPKLQISRRLFLGGLAGGALAAIASPATAMSIDTMDLEVTSAKLVCPRLPKSFDGYRIGFLSDPHLGVFMPDEAVREAVAAVNAAKVDLVLLGGDYIGIPDSFPGKYFDTLRNPKFAKPRSASLVNAIYQQVSSILSALECKDGIFGILGNHDVWNDRRLCLRGLAPSKISLLVNQFHSVKRGTEQIFIYGVDDLWTGVPRISELRKISDAGSFVIVLAHNPDIIAETVSGIKFDIGLAGHTHGGQINIPFVGPIAGYNVRNTRYRSGLVSEHGSHVYVSRGIGVVEIPYRLNCRPEVTIFELASV